MFVVYTVSRIVRPSYRINYSSKKKSFVRSQELRVLVGFNTLVATLNKVVDFPLVSCFYFP